jgi:hypothetical protein
MFAHTETQSSAPGDADEARPRDDEFIKDGQDISDPEWHRVRSRLVRLVAPTLTTVVDEHTPELVGELLKGSGDRGC